MFLIVPLLLLSGLLSVLTILIGASLYGLELVLIALAIRNVRQETSRESLQKFLRWTALDHVLSAATAFGSAVLLVGASGSQRLVPLLQSNDNPDNTSLMGMAAVLAFFSVTWILVAVILWLIAPSMESRAALERQLQWHGWTLALIIVGLLMSLATGWLFLLMSLPLLWHVVHSARMGRQTTLMWTLAIAIRQGLPLGPEILSASEGLWGRERLRLQLLSENLDAGMSLATSLERQPGLVPRSSVMLIRMGEETNMVAEALEACAVSYSRRHDRESDLVNAQQAFLILLLPLIVIPNIVGFLCYYIVPKFKKIFEDFGTELPDMTIGMIQMADAGSGLAMLIVMGSIGAGALIVIMNIRDWELDWPLLNVLAPRVNGPPVLRALALVIRENRSVTAGIQGMMWSHPRATVRRRLSHIYQSLQHGGDLAECLAQERLIRNGDIHLLRSAERVRNLPWCLEQLAEGMERKFWYRLRAVLEFGYPVAVLLLGAVVFFVVAGFFMPLVKLLNDLS